MGVATWRDWRISMLISGCIRLRLRVCGPVILCSSDDVVIRVFFLLIPLYMLFSFSLCKMACKIWVVYYPMYIDLTNWSSFLSEKRKKELELQYTLTITMWADFIIKSVPYQKHWQCCQKLELKLDQNKESI